MGDLIETAQYEVDLVCMETGDGETVTVEAHHHSKAAPKAIEQSTLTEPSLSSTWVNEHYTATQHND